MLKRLSVLLLTAFAALLSFATDYTWSGEGAAGLWQDPANWSGGDGISYPIGGDKAIIGADVAFSDVVAVASDLTLTIAVASGTTVSFDGGFSGAGKFLFSGAGTVSLNAASLSFTGETEFSAGVARLSVQGALGSGQITLSGSSKLNILQPMTVANAIYVPNRLKGVDGTTKAADACLLYQCDTPQTTVEFAGQITCTDGLCFSFGENRPSGGQVAVFSGGIVSTATANRGFGFSGTQKNATGGNFLVRFTAPIVAPTWRITSMNGVLNASFEASGNSWRDLRFDRSTVTFTAANVLPATSTLFHSGNYYPVTYDMKGDQEFAGAVYDAAPSSKGNSPTIKNSGATISRITLRSPSDAVWYGAWAGKLSCVWAPLGDFTLTLPAADDLHLLSQSMTGALIASNGTINVTDSFTGVTALEAYNAGRIDIPSGVTFGAVKTIRIADEGMISFAGSSGLPKLQALELLGSSTFSYTSSTPLPKLASVAVSGTPKVSYSAAKKIWCDSLTVNGEAKVSGYYNIGGVLFGVTATPAPVTATEVVWDGGAGESDTRFSTKENWEDDRTPDFSTGTAKPVFNGSAVATVDAPDRVAGLKVAGEGSSVTLHRSGSGALSLTENASEITAGAQVSIEPDLSIETSHAVRFGLGSVTRLDGRLNGNTVRALALIGTQRKLDTIPAWVTLDGGEEGSAFSGELSVTNVSLHAKGKNPFGNGYGSVYLRFSYDNAGSVTTPGYSNTSLRVENAVIPNDLAFYSSGANSYRTLDVMPGTYNELNGYVTFPNDKSRYINVGSGATLVFGGGLLFKSNNMYLDNFGTVIVTNEAVRFETGASYFVQTYLGQVYLHAPGNCFGNNMVFKSKNDALYIRTDNAIESTTLSRFGRNNTDANTEILDLGGHDVEFIGCKTSYSSASVTSDAPAKLVFAGNLDCINKFVCRGYAGFEQAGSGTSTVAVVNASLGTLGASGSGLVKFGANGRWMGDLALSESGEIDIASAAQISKKASVFLSGDDCRLNLTGTVRVRFLYKNGVSLPPGKYTSSELVNIGSGTLEVTGIPGVLIIVR